MSVQRVADNWGWFLAFGLLLIVMGVVALAAPLATTVVAMEFFGVLLLVGAVAQWAHAYHHRDWGGAMLGVLLGALYVAAGVALMTRPVLGAAVFTLMLGFAVLLGGVARVLLSFMHRRFTGWLMMLLGGLVSLLLGGLIVAGWPESLVVIGVFIGVDLIVGGLSWVALALTARELSVPAGHVPG